MKKKTIILPLVMLSLCMIFAACNSTKSTEKSSTTESGGAKETKSSLVGGVLEQNNLEKEARKHWTNINGNHASARKKVEYKHFSSLNTMQMELSAGRVDYLRLSGSVANYLTASDDKLKVVMGRAHLHYHMAVRADDTALYEEVNNAIDALKGDGTLDKLAADYITGADHKPAVNQLKKHEGAETHIVAVTGDLPPLDYVTADGKPAGFNVALLNAISEKCGCNFKIVQLDAAARLSALKSKKVDLIFWIGCFNNKDFEPKVDNISLSTPYYEDQVCWVSYSADILNKVKSNYKKSNIPALTMDKVSEVNTVTHLLEKYKTVTYAQLDYIGGNTMHITYFKDKSGDCCCTEDDFEYSGYRTDGINFSREKGKSTYHLSAIKDLNVSDYLFLVPGGNFTSQTTDESGNLVCEAEADISQEYADQLSKSWPVTTKDKMVTTTVFAADDNRVLSVDFAIRRPDGSELKIASGVLLYDKEVSYTDAVKNYLDDSKYTVTVKMVDGSVRTAQIPKGKSFTWECDDGYALYTDKDGKTALSKKSDPVKSDLTLYCLAKK